MPAVLYVADRRSPTFEAVRTTIDVVCAGDSITGWNNFGSVTHWPYRTYPEFLQRLCEPLGLAVANGGIAGEISGNGVGQVREYLELFPKARYFVLGYGSNDIDKWPVVEETTPRIIENLNNMVEAIRRAGRAVTLLDVLNTDESRLERDEAEALRRKLTYHNEKLRDYCLESRVPLVEVWDKLRAEHFDDPFHPNPVGAQIIAQEVFRVLSGLTTTT